MTSVGDLLQCHHGREEKWYVFRATYARDQKVQADLTGKGVRTFIPMMWRDKKLVPVVTGLVFVFGFRGDHDRYIRSFGDDRPVNYYWDRTTNRSLTITYKAMEDFIIVASTMDPTSSTLPRSAISFAKVRGSWLRKAHLKVSRVRLFASVNPVVSCSRF